MANIRNRYLFLSDLVLLAAAPFAAYAIRFEGTAWTTADSYTAFLYAALSVALKLSIFLPFGMYSRLWRHASIPDLAKITEATATSAAACAVLGLFALSASGLTTMRVPISVIILDSFLTVTAVAAPRLLVRVLGTLPHVAATSNGASNGASNSRRALIGTAIAAPRLLIRVLSTGHIARASNGRRALIAGAGTAGQTILRELLINPQLGLTPVGFADDDPRKRHHRLNNLPVLGTLSQIPSIITRHHVDEILIAMPHAPGAVVRSVVRAAAEAKVPVRTVPGLFDLLSGRVSVSPLQQVEIKELPRRDPIKTSFASPATIATGQAVELPRGQRILITGGTGFIGTALTERLCAENEVVILDRKLDGSSWTMSGHNGHPNVRIVLGDILDAGTVARALEGVDSVIHLAAIVGVNAVRARPRATIETNFLGTLTLLRAVEQLPVLPRLVYFSTSEVFGINSFRVQECMSTSIGPVQETRWSYSISKLVGEHLLQCYYREAGVPTVTIRPFNVFGPGRVGDHALLRFVLSALIHEDIIVHGTGDQVRSWCYIDDFVNGVLAALVRPEAVGEDFNLGNPRNTLTIYELAKRVVNIIGSSSKIQFVQTNYADIDIRVPHMEKARRLLGFEPNVDIDEGIQRTVPWCAQHFHELTALLAAAPGPVCAQDTKAREALGGATVSFPLPGAAPLARAIRASGPWRVQLPGKAVAERRASGRPSGRRSGPSPAGNGNGGSGNGNGVSVAIQRRSGADRRLTVHGAEDR
jgi:UDP-glucose 4-epimerase